MRPRPLLPRPLLLLAALALGACAEARMPTPPSLGPGQALPVAGRDPLRWREGFTFGAWTVRRVDRGWSSSTAWTALGLSSVTTSAKLQFVVAREGGPTLRAQGATGAKLRDLQGLVAGGVVPVDLALADEATVAVVFLEEGQDDPARALRLVLHGPSEGPLSGALVVPGAEPVRVEGTRALAGTSLPAGETSGYTFLRGGRAIGAVEVVNAGRVFLAPSLSEAERDALAAASAMLLLYRGPELPAD